MAEPSPGNSPSRQLVCADKRPLKALVLEDVRADADLMIAGLSRAGYKVISEIADSLARFRDLLAAGPWDVILTDFNRRTWTAFDALEALRQSGRDIPLLVVTGTLVDETAVELIKQGAADFVLKDRMARLPSTLERVLREKTLRQEREQALGEAARLAAIVESSGDAIVGEDLHGMIQSWNRGATRLYGYTAEEAKGRHASFLLPPGRREELSAVFDRLRHGENIEHFETEQMTKDGRTIQVSLTISPSRDATGAVAGASTIARNVTELKRTQVAVVRLREAVGASGEVIFMTNREGVITFINPEFTRLYGHEEAEVVGKATPRILKSDTKNAEEYREFWRALLEKRGVRWETVNRAKDGHLVTVEASANPILDEHGEIAGFLAIQRDITARKQLEEQFRQAQKMEAVGRLAGGVAHDFNNMLTVINGYSELLLSEPDLPAAHKSRVEEIKKAGDRAAALTRQLLAFTRQQVLQPEVLDLSAVISDLGKLLVRLIGEDIELAIVPAKGLWRVKADPSQLEQVLMNLAVNARDAMLGGGKLTIETSNVELDTTYGRNHPMVKPGKYVLLAVSDTGHGMDAETQAHIFEPFFTTKPKGKGTGLGLATVYGIVKQSGGSIWVYSEPGRGTTIKVYLPAVEKKVAYKGSQASGSGERVEETRGSETILLVEDEEAVRSFARDVLKSKGYQVLVAAGGEEGLHIARQTRPPIHLLLTDLVMPNTNGRELARQLVQTHPETKCLFMSGYTEEAAMRSEPLAEGSAFVQKPFTAEAMARKVRELLDAA